MPLGEMITSLRADLSAYEKDLNAAYAQTEAWSKKVEALQVRLSATSMGGSGGAGASFARRQQDRAEVENLTYLDNKLRRIETARKAAEAEERRREGSRAAAEREERRRGAEQPTAERENIRRDEQREAAARRVVAVQQKAQQEDEQRDFRRLQYQERRRDNDRKALAEQTGAERENIRRDEQREAANRRAVVVQQKAESDNRRRDEQHEASVRRTVVVQQNAERENIRRDEQREAAGRRMIAVQQQAERQNAERREEQARSFFHRQAGERGGFGGIANGGPGGFLAPASLRGLGEADQAWLKQQQAIVKTGSLLERFGLKVGDLGAKAFGGLVEHVKRFGSSLATVVGVGAGAGLVGGLLAVGKAALDVDRAYQVGRIALAETLSLTTDLVDRQGKLVSSSRQMTENYAVSAKLYQQIRAEAIKTTLTTGELLRTTEQSMAFAIRGGARVEQVVPLVAQIANLAKSLGAHGETQIGFEERALLTGQNLSRSRIGRALGLSKEEITQARDSGKIVELLTKVLAKGKPYLDDYAHSYDGLVSTLQSKTQELLRQGTEKTFAKITESLGDLNKRFDQHTISEWAERLSEVLAQTIERLQTLANLPVWKTLHDNFAFLFFDEGEATERQIAARRNARGPNQTAVELARIQVRRRQDELTALQAAAAGRALPLAEQAGAGPKMISRFISPGDQEAIAVQERLLQRDVERQKAAEDELARVHIQHELQKGSATGDRLKRVLRLQSEANEKTKQDAEDERIETAKRLAQMREDKIAELRAEAEAEIRKVNEDVKSEANRAKLIAGIRQQLTRDITDERRKERNDLAEARLKERQLIAQAAGDELKRIELRNVADLQGRIKQIEGDKLVTDKRGAIQRAYTEERIKNEKEVAAKVHELNQRGRDLRKQIFDEETTFHKARVHAEKEIGELQRRTAKELRDLVREQTDAQRDLNRAQIDRTAAQARLFGLPEQRSDARFLPGAQGLLESGAISGRIVPGGVLIPSRVTKAAQPAFVDERESIRKATEELFSGNVGELLQGGLLRQGLSPDLAQAQSERQIRNLIESAQRPGGTKDVMEQFQQAGVSIGPEFRRGLEGIEARSTRLQGQEEDAARQAEQEAVRREKEDSARAVENAQRMVRELDEKQAETLKSYRDQAIALRVDFTKAVVDTSGGLRKLTEELQKLSGTLRASHLPAPGAAGPSGAAAAEQIKKEAAPTNQLIVNGLEIHLTGKAAEGLKAFAEELEAQRLRTAPARR